MSEIIAITNQKGGVGKSTTALAIGFALAKKGKKVLFIDMDAQGNLTYTLGATIDNRNIMQVLMNEADIQDCIKELDEVELITSVPTLSGADGMLVETGKEYRLQEALENIKKLYDYVIIDTPPALSILTVNALTAADSILIPAQADAFSLQGIGQFYKTYETVKKYCNPKLKTKGILITRFNARSVLSKDMKKMLEKTAEQMGTCLFKTEIRECVATKEAQASRKNIFDYAKRSNVAKDYEMLTNEIFGV